MQSKKSLLWALLISVSIFCVILSFLMYRHLKEKELEFNTNKARLIKENMDLKDNVSTLKDELVKQAEAVTHLGEENQKLKDEYVGVVDKLREENAAFGARIKELEGRPLIQQLRDAAYNEDNENLRKFLEKVLYNIVLIKSGKSIELEPTVVAEHGEDSQAQALTEAAATAE